MTKNSFFLFILLIAVWVVLQENISLFTLAAAMLLSFICTLVYYLSIEQTAASDFRLRKLLIYPFYLIFQIYFSAILLMRLIFGKAEAKVVTVDTRLKSQFLRSLLATSLTLAPGTIALDIDDDQITVLWLIEKDAPIDLDEIETTQIGKLEKMLSRAEE